ncbi:hypothetical protein Plhal304r1_c090g0171111 [Plasmopara halstedii]
MRLLREIHFSKPSPWRGTVAAWNLTWYGVCSLPMKSNRLVLGKYDFRDIFMLSRFYLYATISINCLVVIFSARFVI